MLSVERLLVLVEQYIITVEVCCPIDVILTFEIVSSHPFTLKISSAICLTVCHIIL